MSNISIFIINKKNLIFIRMKKMYYLDHENKHL